MKTKIYDTDPYLMPYKGAIDARSERILDMRRHIAGNGLLKDAVNNHIFYGLHRCDDRSWVFREWAPNATKIYLINPEAPAEKFLLARILCGPLNLANYEGMCLGPQVDGKQTLLLLADSQDSAGGLIPEYIQLIITE